MSAIKAIFDKKTIQLFLIMAIIGFIGNLRGVLLPEIRQDLGLSYTDVGLMIFVSSIGYMSANLLGGIAGSRFGQRKVIMFGFAILPLGILGLYFTNSLLSLIVGMTLVGIGLASFDVGLNSLASRIFVVNTALMMNALHFFYGAGSSVSPQFASLLLLRALPWNAVYACSIVIVAIVFLIFFLNPVKLAAHEHSEHRTPLIKLFCDVRIWLFIGVLGFSEAAEIGTVSWLVNFLQADRGMTQSISAQFMFFFFIIFTSGRIFGGLVVEKFGYFRTIFISSSIIVVLFVSGLVLGSKWTLLFSLTGLFYSILFPTIIAIVSKVFTKDSSSVIGVILTFAGMIGMMSNWFIGKLNDSYNVFVGFSSIPVFELVFLVLLFVLNRYLKKLNNFGEPGQNEEAA